MAENQLVELQESAGEYPGHTCDAPVSVLLAVDNGPPIRIPVIEDGVTVHERKGGPIAVSRRVEVDFPLESHGEAWHTYVDAYAPEGAFQQAAIAMQPLNKRGEPDGPEQFIMRGYIGSVGSAGDNVGHLTIFGPYNMMGNISAENTFGERVDVYEAAEWVVNELNNSQDVLDEVALAVRSPDTAEEAREIRESNDFSVPEGGIPRFGRHTYTADKHTLADVVEDIGEATGEPVWFRTAPDGRNILAFGTRNIESYDGRQGGDLYTIENNALFEMRPFNTIKLNGERQGDADYPVAEAWYPDLVERAGGKITVTEEVNTDILPVMLKAAQKRLKDRLNAVSGGTATFALAPQVRPFDTVELRPACAGQIESEMPSLTYEVERTAHKIAPENLRNNIPQTELSLSMHIDETEIEVNGTSQIVRPQEVAEGDNWNKPDDYNPPGFEAQGQ
jgi:hypothetical protein